MVKERLKFYADTDKAKNQYFCWELSSILTLKEAIWRFFLKGWNIRSAWYEKIDTDTGETENIKINIPDLFLEFVEESKLIKPKY